MIMWVLQLICFTSISLLLFGTLPAFKNFFDVSVYYFFSALGNWDMGVYCEATEYTGEPNELLCQVGAYYTVIFLLINNVLMLNLVIALLSSVYTNFEDK